MSEVKSVFAYVRFGDGNTRVLLVRGPLKDCPFQNAELMDTVFEKHDDGILEVTGRMVTREWVTGTASEINEMMKDGNTFFSKDSHVTKRRRLFGPKEDLRTGWIIKRGDRYRVETHGTWTLIDRR